MLGLILIVIVGYMLTVMLFSVIPTVVIVYFFKFIGVEFDPAWISGKMLANSISTDRSPSKK